jgi:hypothetical protein
MSNERQDHTITCGFDGEEGALLITPHNATPARSMVQTAGLPRA